MKHRHHTLREAHEQVHGRKKMAYEEKPEAALAAGIAGVALGERPIVLPYGCPNGNSGSRPPVSPTMWIATLEAPHTRGGLAFIHLKCAHCGDSIYLEVPEPGPNSHSGERLAKARKG